MPDPHNNSAPKIEALLHLPLVLFVFLRSVLSIVILLPVLRILLRLVLLLILLPVLRILA